MLSLQGMRAPLFGPCILFNWSFYLLIFLQKKYPGFSLLQPSHLLWKSLFLLSPSGTQPPREPRGHNLHCHSPNNLDGASLVAQRVKCLPAMQETQVQSLGWEDPLEKEMATLSSTLAWKIPWMEEPGGLQFLGSQRVRHDWVTDLNWLNQRSVKLFWKWQMNMGYKFSCQNVMRQDCKGCVTVITVIKSYHHLLKTDYAITYLG